MEFIRLWRRAGFRLRLSYGGQGGLGKELIFQALRRVIILSEKVVKNIRIWLLFINFAVIVSYGLILFFTNWAIVAYPEFKVALAFAGLNIIGFPIISRTLEGKPKRALELAIFGLFLYLFILIEYFGGPTGVLFPIIYILLLAALIYDKVWGLVVFIFITAYIAFHIFISGGDPITLVVAHSTSIISVLLSLAGGFLLGDRVRKLIKENTSLTGMASKATAEKTQEEAVLTAIPDGVYAVDMNRNLVLFNKAAQEMTNWAEKDVLGLKCQTVMNLKKEDNASVCEKDCPAMAVWNTGEAVFRNDTCFTHKKSKKRIQLSSSYAPIKDFQNKVVGALCVFRDITKEKEVERLRNEFVSTASHELRTPITATEGYLSIVTDSGMCKVDEKSKEYIGKAKATLMAMSKLTKNLLSVTKIEEGKLETNITNFSIHDLTKEVVGIFKKQADEKGIKLELVESKNLSVKDKKAIGRSLNVHADQEMIKEVINNLIENAIKFTEKGGVLVSIDYDEEFATVNVEDTGMGMPPEAEKHLFEKFYRVDNTATREVGGTGLGLYITRSIVEIFGGRIWIESSPGKGSKFHFTIPLALD